MSILTSPALRYSKSPPSYNPLPQGCVLWIPFWYPTLEEASFKSMDSFGHSCTVAGTNTVKAVGGVRARYLDGTGDFVSCGTNPALNFTTGDFSVVVRCYLEDTGSHRVIVGGSSTNTPSLYSRNTETILLSKPSTANAPAASTPMPEDVWTTLGYSFDNSEAVNNLCYYFNGAPDGIVSFDRDFSDYLNTIGATNNGGWSLWKGSVFEVGIYNRILSANEHAHWHSQVAGRSS